MQKFKVSVRQTEEWALYKETKHTCKILLSMN